MATTLFSLPLLPLLAAVLRPLLHLLLGALVWVALQTLPTLFISRTRKRCFVERGEADATLRSLTERDPRTMAGQWNLLT